MAGATNAALALATGDYLAFLDHDDELTPDALYHVVKAINEHDPDLIYSDEDKLSLEGYFLEPHFKPDYLPDLIFIDEHHLPFERLSSARYWTKSLRKDVMYGTDSRVRRITI
ncbi:MAG: glycosyltransferase [Candidatus Competibacteraceae bacterium]|nr:glycosyltransferase [Candidatus Competibacteraceae bacterium]